ncbi:MAG: hypothetical protein SPL94_08265 [Oribacterium sp.]|nr:hypothetical protein [Oribacterium sp.]
MWSLKDIPSRNAGVREFQVKRDNEGYDTREEILRELYRKFGKKADYYDIYVDMQGLDRDVHVFEEEEKFEALRDEALGCPEKWSRCFLDFNGSGWLKFDLDCPKERKPRLSDFAMVKVYVSLKDFSKVMDIYYGAVKLLTQQADNRFHSKASRYKRTDCMCFWVSRNDFYLLEKYFEKLQDELECSVPFVPYRGKLGISREFLILGSHSSEEAELISRYFRTVDRVEDVDLGEMYALFVREWNSPIEDPDHRLETFHYFNAQSLLILLDSIDVISGRTEIIDDHLFLTEDEPMWRALGSSYSWDDVPGNYQKELDDLKWREEHDS